MGTLEILSIIASVVSVLIGGFAIWLSITFYRMSNRIAEDIRDSANQINSNISTIQALFDRMYSDIFSIAKDTFSDYRQHTWKPEASAKTENLEKQEKVREIRDESSREIERILKHQAVTDDKISKLARDLGSVLNRAIDKSTKLERETLEGDLRKSIVSTINELHKHDKEATLLAVMIALGLNPGKTHVKGDAMDLFIEELFRMRKEGLLYWEPGEENEIRPDSYICVT